MERPQILEGPYMAPAWLSISVTYMLQMTMLGIKWVVQEQPELL